MKRTLSVILIIAVLCIYSPAYGEVTKFEPDFVNSMNITARSWMESQGNCALLSALLMLDVELKLNTNKAEEMFDFDVHNDTFVGRSDNVIYVGYYNDTSILFVLYDTSEKIAGCMVQNTAMPSTMAQYIIKSECGSCYAIDGSDVYDMLIMVSNALDS